MELRSGRRLRQPPPSPYHGARCHSRCDPDVETDLISSLPDEMLLLVLARLGCIRAAVQTSLLSRRWRGLWTGLTDLNFSHLAPTTVEAVLSRFSHSSVVSLCDIRFPVEQPTPHANSLLCSAARLLPGKLVFTLLQSQEVVTVIELPCLPSTTSIELNTWFFFVNPSAAGEYTVLEKLSLFGNMVSFGEFLSRCPRLRAVSVCTPYRITGVICVTPPPGGDFTALESLSLTGEIAGLDDLLKRCRSLRVLNITYMDYRQLMLPLASELPVLENLSLSGNIVDLTTWLNRCPRLRVLSVTFHGLTLRSLEAALATLKVARPFDLQLSLLGFKGIDTQHNRNTPCFASLLHTAARLSPQEFLFEGCSSHKTTEPLPSFHRTTSILGMWTCLQMLPGSDFPYLERLSLSRGCTIVNLASMVSLCPRLRELRVTEATCNIKVHSESLQKLHVYSKGDTKCIDILTPVLKQLKLVVHDDGDMSVSILAPTVEKVWWTRVRVGSSALVFRFWSLRLVRLETAQDTCSLGVLCLSICASKHLGAKKVFTKQMEKFLVTDFSVLDLHFSVLELHLEDESEHRFGALVMCLFRIRQICDATKRLKIFQPCTQRVRKCQGGTCPFDGTKKWTKQNIYSTCLEEVEMDNFNGDDCEHEFLILILRCSPMLKRVSLKLSSTVGRCTTEVVDNIFLAYPSVSFCVYNSSGKLAQCTSG